MGAQDVIGVGVVGLGRMGKLHARAVAACHDSELRAVCDPDPQTHDEARALGAGRVTGDLEELLQDDLDAVIIASPTALHAEHVAACARVGAAIYVEKPIALSSASADLALRSVVTHGVGFQVGFQRRWDPRYRAVRSAIEAGEIGDPVLVKAHGRDPGPSDRRHWGLDRNGGIFLNCAIHDYDAARFLTGADITAVSASSEVLVHHDLRSVGDADTCASTLWLSDGSMALTEWSRFATHGYDIGVEVVGTRGSILLNRGSASESPVLVRRTDRRVPQMLDVFGDSFSAAIHAFIAAVRNRRPHEPGIDDARQALQAALAARASSVSGGRRVDIPPLLPLAADRRAIGQAQRTEATA